MTSFESQVLADLCVLKTHMESVIGGMQPGRLTRLEQRVERHETYLQRVHGIAGVFAVLLTLVNAAIDFHRR